MTYPTISKGFTWTPGATVMPSRLNLEIDAATLNFTKTNVFAARQTAGAGVAEEADISTVGFSLVAAANATAMRVVLGVGSNSFGNRTVSTSAPSAGSDGDLWLQV